jgi:hypothetical protein
MQNEDMASNYYGVAERIDLLLYVIHNTPDKCL